MAQQGSIFESHGSWYVRWWEKGDRKTAPSSGGILLTVWRASEIFRRSRRSNLSSKSSWIAEPLGKFVERGNRNRGFLRERLHSGSNRNVRMLDCEGVQRLLAVPHSRPSEWSSEGLQDV
jgi:hypothetical protein